MLSSLLFFGSVLSSLAVAAPSSTGSFKVNIPADAPSWFDPTRKYPPKVGSHLHNATAGNGAWGGPAGPKHHSRSEDKYDFVKRAAEIASRFSHVFERQSQPEWGPGSYVNNGAALGWYNGNLNSGTGGIQPSSTYQCFGGNVNNYPPYSEWMNFYNLFDLNQQNQMAFTPDSGEQQGEIYNAIVQISQQSLVDARLIIAVIMQESSGNVYVPCTAGYNCGLMQANHGSVSYNPGNGVADSQNSINQMVTDGTEGTTQGPGYVQYLNGGSSYAYTNCPLGNPYGAARAYNSGSCSTSGNLNCAPFGTASYVNDITNRLIGWDGNGAPQGQCGFPGVGSGC